MTSQAKRTGQNVKVARKRARLTQEGLAHAAQVSVATVSRLEQGRTEYPRGEEFERIAAALNTTTDALRATPDPDSHRPGSVGDSTAILLPPPDPLIDRLRRIFGPDDVDVITDWLDETEGYAPEDKAFTVQTVEWLKTVMQGARNYRNARTSSRQFARI